MFLVIAVSFVIVGILVLVLRESLLRRKALLEWLELEDEILAEEYDDYSGLPRMDVPLKYPALRTRSTKAL